MDLQSLTEPGLIFPDLRCPDAAGLLRELAHKLVELGSAPDAAQLFAALWEREQLGSTAIGYGVAVPHCKLDGLERVVLAVGILAAGIDFGAADEQPVRVFFCIVSPNDSPAAHLQCLAAVSRWVKDGRHVERILELADPQEIYGLFHQDGA